MKRLTLLLLISGYISTVSAQGDALMDSAILNMNTQLFVFPHEKVYVHTDKPYYINGEKIFFRIFLLDAYTNTKSPLSRYVYVELINPVDSVVARVRIRPDEQGLFHGAVSLPEDLPQGTYKMRAYTQYMGNQDESLFFSKYVTISDPQTLSIQTDIDFQFVDDRKINATLRFINAKTGDVIQPQSVVLRVNQERFLTRRPDREGRISAELNVPSNASSRILYVELKDGYKSFRQYLQIPYPEGNFDISFYPEGGQMIAGQMSTVAFKAVNTYGASLDVQGEIIDSKGSVVTGFKTFYGGMGEFTINPRPSERYQAVCSYNGRTLKFNLPEAQVNSFSLKTGIRDNRLWITVNKNASASLPKLYLMIHSGGSVLYAKAWDPSRDFITLNIAGMYSGISHVLLLTEDLQTVSERLVFILNDNRGFAEVQPQKSTYQKREQVLTEIRLKDGDRKPLTGNFSISVTNDGAVMPDTTTSIMSGILLRSELKGVIENPEYYFRRGDRDAEFAADLLMKTHGWRRYSVPDVLRGKFSYPEIPFEESMGFAGTVKSGLFSRLAKGFNVTLLSIDAGFYGETVTDDNGRFAFRDFEYPDSTSYIVRALNSQNKGERMAELYVDNDIFPKIGVDRSKFLIHKEKDNSLLVNYITKADLQYTYQNGMRMIYLPEIAITPKRPEHEERYRASYASILDYSITDEDIAKSPPTDMRRLLSRLPRVQVTQNSIRIHRAPVPPLLFIDGMRFTATPTSDTDLLDILDSFDVEDISRVEVPYNTDMFGGGDFSGVIAIYTKSGSWVPKPRQKLNVRRLVPLGYQSPVEFYSPKYDSKERVESPEPDLRTTVYWKPNAVTDSEGNVKLDFYTSDDTTTYTVIIEGMSDDGRLIHYRGRSLVGVK